jgi:hypothetical protein
VAPHTPRRRPRATRRAWLRARHGAAALGRKTLGIDFPGTTSPMITRLAHVHIPDQYRHPGSSSIEIPGFGLLPFGHNRFDRGGVIYAEFEAGRSLLGPSSSAHQSPTFR